MANIPATYIAGQCYTGMPVQDFMALAGKKALMVRMENGWNVYKILEVVPGLGGFQDRSKFFSSPTENCIQLMKGFFDLNGFKSKSLTDAPDSILRGSF